MKYALVMPQMGPYFKMILKLTLNLAISDFFSHSMATALKSVYVLQELAMCLLQNKSSDFLMRFWLSVNFRWGLHLYMIIDSGADNPRRSLLMVLTMARVHDDCQRSWVNEALILILYFRLLAIPQVPQNSTGSNRKPLQCFLL